MESSSLLSSWLLRGNTSLGSLYHIRDVHAIRSFKIPQRDDKNYGLPTLYSENLTQEAEIRALEAAFLRSNPSGWWKKHRDHIFKSTFYWVKSNIALHLVSTITYHSLLFAWHCPKCPQSIFVNLLITSPAIPMTLSLLHLCCDQNALSLCLRDTNLFL